MISLFRACTILPRTGSLVTKSPGCGYFYPSWATSFKCLVVETVNLNLMLSRFQVQCCSSKKSAGDSCSKPKIDCKPKQSMKRKSFLLFARVILSAFTIALSDCQAQVGTSICNPPVSVYRGCSMPKDTEDYLLSCGRKNALFSIGASDLTEDLFGTLVACPFQPSSSRGQTSSEPITKKRSQKALRSDYEPSSGENASKPRARRNHRKF